MAALTAIEPQNHTLTQVGDLLLHIALRITTAIGLPP